MRESCLKTAASSGHARHPNLESEKYVWHTIYAIFTHALCWVCGHVDAPYETGAGAGGWAQVRRGRSTDVTFALNANINTAELFSIECMTRTLDLQVGPPVARFWQSLPTHAQVCASGVNSRSTWCQLRRMEVRWITNFMGNEFETIPLGCRSMAAVMCHATLLGFEVHICWLSPPIPCTISKILDCATG